MVWWWIPIVRVWDSLDIDTCHHTLLALVAIFKHFCICICTHTHEHMHKMGMHTFLLAGFRRRLAGWRHFFPPPLPPTFPSPSPSPPTCLCLPAYPASPFLLSLSTSPSHLSHLLLGILASFLCLVWLVDGRVGWLVLG